MKDNILTSTRRIFVKSFNQFVDFNGLKLSAALSFYTIFSVGPLLLVILSLAGLFFGRMAVEGKVYYEISGLVGADAALQIQNILRYTHESGNSKMGGLIGTIILIVGASGVFSEIQTSIHSLWGIPTPRKKILLMFILRKLLSFSLLIAVAFLLMVSLIASSLLDILSDRLKSLFSDSLLNWFYLLNQGLILLVISCLFALMFKVLPHSSLSWKHAFAGAIVTAVLFLIGKFVIGYYLGHSQIGTTYGAAASIVILMLWIYYSSIILYFGACFTAALAENRGQPIG